MALWAQEHSRDYTTTDLWADARSRGRVNWALAARWLARGREEGLRMGMATEGLDSR